MVGIALVGRVSRESVHNDIAILRTEGNKIDHECTGLRGNTKYLVDVLCIADVVLVLDFDVVAVGYVDDRLPDRSADVLEEILWRPEQKTGESLGRVLLQKPIVADSGRVKRFVQEPPELAMLSAA